MNMMMKAGLALVVALLVAVAIGGCDSAVEATSVRFSVLRPEGPVTREASAAEVRRFNQAYAKAKRLSDDNGTTPLARIDAVLESGESLVVWGGGQYFETVLFRGEQFNVEGEELDRLLREIVAADENR